MTIEVEISVFNENNALLGEFIDNLANLDAGALTQREFFLAEAVTFRLFRNYERFTRSVFLNYCTQNSTPSGVAVVSKLNCADWDTAEEILKSGNKFLDWGNVTNVRALSNLVFENGFPINDILGPINSTLIDLIRFRNFIAHDSKEAENGFKKSIDHYVKVGAERPTTVGELALYRRKSNADVTLKIVHGKVKELTTIHLQT